MDEITSKEVYARLVREIADAEFERRYQELRRSIAELGRYGAPADLVAALGSGNLNYDEKDSCLYGLIVASRRRDQIGAAAITLLLVTIWPTLVLITSRLRHLLKEASDPLAEVYWAFLQELDRPTYDRRWKVAANLARNTAKRAVSSLRSEWSYQESLRDIHDWAARSVEDSAELFGCLFRSPTELSDEDRHILAEAAQKLAEASIITAEEALLLVGHAIYETPLKDLASEQGVTHDALRQRHCRLKAKLRLHFGLR